jgi:hypothetical protein
MNSLGRFIMVLSKEFNEVFTNNPISLNYKFPISIWSSKYPKYKELRKPK